MVQALRRMAAWLFGPRSQFNIGDAVQLMENAERFMVVTGIDPGPEDKARIHCQWEDPKYGSQKACFLEKELRLFDWDRAYRKTQVG